MSSAGKCTTHGDNIASEQKTTCYSGFLQFITLSRLGSLSYVMYLRLTTKPKRIHLVFSSPV